MKLDLGCGPHKPEGYIGIDKFKADGVDIVWDLDKTPWEPLRPNTFDMIRANHVLEHLSDVCASMVEIYRVAKPNAEVHIGVPAPSHDDYWNDPTHKSFVTPEMMALFSKEMCRRFREMGAPNTPLADYLDVDFEVKPGHAQSIIDDQYKHWLDEGDVVINKLMRENRNVIKEYRIVLIVKKGE